MSNNQFVTVFDRQIQSLFKKAIRITLFRPALLWHFIRTLYYQWRAMQKRRRLEKRGQLIPPIMIASVTQKCNLACKTCYARELPQAPANHLLELAEYVNIFQQARTLGLSMVILAGGEPLLRQDIFDITRELPEITFALFTNGLLLNQDKIRELKQQRQVIPVISLEGREAETDERRGAGTFARLQQVMEQFQTAGIFWGVSLTATSQNLATLLEIDYIKELVQQGCGLFFFIEYVPLENQTQDLVLADGQRHALYAGIDELNARFPALCIALPGNESIFDGCLSAGRGFIHLAPDGSLEPCPFAPYSDVNLKTTSLQDALQSKLMQTIRENHAQLSELEGGCALWSNREWIKSLLKH